MIRLLLPRKDTDNGVDYTRRRKDGLYGNTLYLSNLADVKRLGERGLDGLSLNDNRAIEALVFCVPSYEDLQVNQGYLGTREDASEELLTNIFSFLNLPMKDGTLKTWPGTPTLPTVSLVLQDFSQIKSPDHVPVLLQEYEVRSLTLFHCTFNSMQAVQNFFIWFPHISKLTCHRVGWPGDVVDVLEGRKLHIPTHWGSHLQEVHIRITYRGDIWLLTELNHIGVAVKKLVIEWNNPWMVDKLKPSMSLNNYIRLAESSILNISFSNRY